MAAMSLFLRKVDSEYINVNNHPVKILHIIVGLEIGGAELMLSRLVGALADHPHQTHEVVSLTTVGTVGKALRKQGVAVYELRMLSTFGMAKALIQLVRLIRRIKPDVVQTWMYHADFLGGLAARFAGHRAIIWGIRTTDVAAGGARATAIVRKACAMLSHVVPRAIACAAEASKKTHIGLGYDASKMMTIPNGFEFSKLKATESDRNTLRLQCSMGGQDIVIGYLGRFHLAKDQENFVNAAAIVAKQHSNARFMMVGRDLDAANMRLNQWIQATGFADRFVLLGERTDVARCLRSMDIFCLSSRTEGFPNVVAEAMYMQLPCVVTDVGDAALLLGGTGLVVPKENSAALARGLETFLNMAPEGRQEIGRRANFRVVGEYSIERARERFAALYHQVMKKEPA